MICTSKEQTIVSCLDRPWAAGGTEEVVRSLTLLAYIDEEALLSILEPMAAPSKARVGWLLDCMRETWHISDALMEKLHGEIGEGPYHLGRPRSGESGWSQQWNLLLPEKNQEVASWISIP